MLISNVTLSKSGIQMSGTFRDCQTFHPYVSTTDSSEVVEKSGFKHSVENCGVEMSGFWGLPDFPNQSFIYVLNNPMWKSGNPVVEPWGWKIPNACLGLKCDKSFVSFFDTMAQLFNFLIGKYRRHWNSSKIHTKISVRKVDTLC